MGWRDRIVKADKTPSESGVLAPPSSSSPAQPSSWRDRIVKAPQTQAVAPQEEGSGLTLSGVGKAITEELPTIGSVAGGSLGMLASPAGAVAGAGGGYALGKATQDLINQYVYNKPMEAKGIPGKIKDVASDVATGAAMELGGQAIGGALGAGLSKAKSMFGKGAEDLAVSATEATGKQMSNFAPNAGRELLDRKAVTAWATPEVIAQRLKAQMGTAEEGIDQALRELADQGANVDTQTILNTVSKRIGDLSSDPASAPIARGLNTVRNDMLESYTRPDVNPTLIDFETTKRGFKKAAGNWQNPLEGQVGKEAYHIYQKAVEDAATATNPELAKRFIEEKQLYKLLAPIQEAAERKALSQSQAPIVSGVDLAIGVATGNPLSTVASAGTRKIIAPRVKSTAAVGLDQISKLVPQLSPKYQALIGRPGTSAAVNHFLLSHQDPDYNAEVQQIMESTKK